MHNDVPIRRNVEVPLSLVQICKNLRLNYKTVRTHSCRLKDFPDPYMTRADGDGVKWFQSQIEAFYKNKKDGRKKDG